MSKPGRSFSSKERNRQDRKEKPLMIITAEGKMKQRRSISIISEQRIAHISSRSIKQGT